MTSIGHAVARITGCFIVVQPGDGGRLSRFKSIQIFLACKLLVLDFRNRWAKLGFFWKLSDESFF